MGAPGQTWADGLPTSQQGPGVHPHVLSNILCYIRNTSSQLENCKIQTILLLPRSAYNTFVL